MKNKHIISLAIGCLICALPAITAFSATGLVGKYYNGYNASNVQSNRILFAGLVLNSIQTNSNFNIWNRDRFSQWNPIGNQSFSVDWTGYLHITNAGMYGFGTISDDGSEIWIDGRRVLDNNEEQWFDWQESYAYLGAGYHTIEITFYEGLSYSGIEVWWLPPTNSSSALPYSGLTFHAAQTNWPSFNTNTLWKILPASVLSTDAPYVNPTLVATFLPVSNQVELAWTSSTNASYTVESSTNLVTWQPSVGPVPGSGGGMTQMVIPAKPVEFFRLRLN